MKRGFRQDTFGTLKFQNDLIMNFNDLLNGEIRHDIFLSVSRINAKLSLGMVWVTANLPAVAAGAGTDG